MDDFSFGKVHRISKESDFARIKREGKRKVSRSFILLQIRNGLSVSRIGIIVTRKVGKANIRNRWKRYVREFYRLNKKLFPEDTDSVFIVKRGAIVPKSFNEISRELEGLIGRR